MIFSKNRELYGLMRSRLLAPYKPETKVTPAPPWVPAVIDTLWPRMHKHHDEFLREALIASALAWCAKGEPVSRAEQITTIARLWPGCAGELVDNFLRTARDLKSGRPAFASPKHVTDFLPRVREAWSDDEGGPFERVRRPQKGEP